MSYLRFCVCVAVYFYLSSHTCEGETTCSQLHGRCLPINSDIHCDGIRRNHTLGCPSLDFYYCCVPNSDTECKRLGGRCQDLRSGLVCWGTMDRTLCGVYPSTYCCIPH